MTATFSSNILYLFLAFCSLSEGIQLNCPFPFLNQNAHLGSEKLCAALQLQTKLPCSSVNLSVSENVRLYPAKWHLESLSLKVEKTCSFTVFQQDKESQHFPGGFYSNINISSINAQSEFVCICPKLHNRYRRDLSDFQKKHLVDIPESPCDTKYWKKKWDDSMNHRKKCAGKNKDFHEPKTQSFMKRQDFNDINKIFTRDSKFQIKNGNRNNLYRSKIKMNIYDVQLKNGVPYVVHRCDYVVAGLDNNGYPVHYEPVTRDIAEQFPVETMSKYMETEETDAPKELKVASMTAIRELSDMIATGEGIAMTADGGCSISEDDESLPGDGTTPVGGDKTLVGDGATQFGVFNNLFQGFNNLFQGFTSLFQGLATLFQGIIDLFSGGMTPVGGAPKKPSATTVATTVAVAVPVPTTAVRKETNVTVAMTVATTAVGKETSVTTAATVAATAVIEGTHMTVATTPFENETSVTTAATVAATAVIDEEGMTVATTAAVEETTITAATTAPGEEPDATGTRSSKGTFIAMEIFLYPFHKVFYYHFYLKRFFSQLFF